MQNVSGVKNCLARRSKKLSYVTIKDIAKHVDVSTATVSLVLSGNPRISEPTSRKVFRAIENLGYSPSTAARSLVLNKTKVISLMVPQLDKIFVRPYFSISISGIYNACIERGYKVQLELVSAEFVKKRRYMKLIQERATDGMISIGSTLKDVYLEEITEIKFPFILLGSYLKGNGFSYVTGDNKRGGVLATSHLISLGRRNIAHIAGNFEVASAVDRFEGYRERMKKEGLNYNSGLVQIGDFSEDGAYHAMKKILVQKPDAVFAGDDLMALGAIKAIQDLGMKVPEDISVCGMDDIPITVSMFPELTTVRYGIYDVAYRATEKLIEMVEGRITEQVEEVMPVELIIRDSCGYKNGRTEGKSFMRGAGVLTREA